MSSITQKNGAFSLRAYRGDFKTLLAFNLDRKSARNLAGFTIQCKPKGNPAYFVHNELQFKVPGSHARDPKEPANSSVNAPIHKFRWVHVPGSVHQGISPFRGKYTYTVTPRYFDKNQSLKPIDRKLSAAVTVDVMPFRKNGLEIGFTRGFTQSQAFVHHFGLKAVIRPKTSELLFDTGQESGVNADGEHFTFKDEYEWLGFTARERVLALLSEVLTNKSLHLDMFAYDLNEPDIMRLLLKLAKQGRVRIILDDASLHHNSKTPESEDQFEKLFKAGAKKTAAIVRGHFNRFAHDKVLIISKGGKPTTVLTGSTNFSVTGLYVNSNHVLIFTDPKVAATYAEVFEATWSAGAARNFFQGLDLAKRVFSFASKATPSTDITFAPHSKAVSDEILDDLRDRIVAEGKKGKTVGSVLFAVMQLNSGTGPILPALQALHENQDIFSFGISDTPNGIFLYKPGSKRGVLVTGKPVKTILPPPFDQVPGVGLGHQVHHKFVVCGFNGAKPVVYCGSSNLASGGEQSNGDNLLAIHDGDAATVFAIEALALVDHFNFLNRFAKAPDAPSAALKHPPALKQQAAVSAGWFLSTTDRWAAPYFDPKDLHYVDRLLFA